MSRPPAMLLIITSQIIIQIILLLPLLLRFAPSSLNSMTSWRWDTIDLLWGGVVFTLECYSSAQEPCSELLFVSLCSLEQSAVHHETCLLHPLYHHINLNHSIITYIFHVDGCLSVGAMLAKKTLQCPSYLSWML